MIRSIVVTDDGMCCMVLHVRLDRANDLCGNAEICMEMLRRSVPVGVVG